VVHQRNSGAAAARNAALRLATGACIAFVDSDDYLEPDAYEKLMEGMLRWDADIVQGKLRNVYVNGSEIIFGGGETVCFSAEAYLARFTGEWTCALSPDKLFRRHVLEDVFYEEGHLIDDEFFTYQVLGNAGTLIRSEKVCYAYRQQESSVMHTMGTDKRLQAVEAKVQRHAYIHDRFPALTELSLKNLWFTCIYQGQISLMGTDKKKARQGILYLRRILKKYPYRADSDIKEKLWISMARISLGITCRVRNLLKIGF
jgi:glycosyltransferase involved in cell wall biosynthesis